MVNTLELEPVTFPLSSKLHAMIAGGRYCVSSGVYRCQLQKYFTYPKNEGSMQQLLCTHLTIKYGSQRGKISNIDISFSFVYFISK